MISTLLSKSVTNSLSAKYFDFLYMSRISSYIWPISYKSFYYNFSWFFFTFLMIFLLLSGFLFNLSKFGSYCLIWFYYSSFFTVHIRCLNFGKLVNPGIMSVNSLKRLFEISIYTRFAKDDMFGKYLSLLPVKVRDYKY